MTAGPEERKCIREGQDQTLTSAMHLEGSDRGHQHHGVRHQARVSALDVHELLHPDVSPEPGLRHHEPGLAHQLEGDPVRQDRGVAVSDVGEGPGMDEDRSPLQRLHESGPDGVLHEDRQGPRHPEVLRRDGVPCPAGGHHHLAQPLPHVGQGGGEGEDRHDLTRHGDVELSGPGVTLLSVRLAWPRGIRASLVS